MKRPPMPSDLERAWDVYWIRHAPRLGFNAEAEYRFAAPRRQWRFDRAWVPEKIAVELEGGVYSGGRHVRGAGFEKDAEKYNAAASLGWLVFRFTAGMLETDPEACVLQVYDALCARELPFEREDDR